VSLRDLTIPGVILLGAGLLCVGCTDTASVSNLPGYVTFVGPHTLTDDGIVTWFGVSDAEGDLMSVAVEVCADDMCFVPELLAGSATIDTVPTERGDVSPALRLIWAPECDVLDNDTPFEVHVRSLSSNEADGVPGVSSAPTTLGQLGWDCGR